MSCVKSRCTSLLPGFIGRIAFQARTEVVWNCSVWQQIIGGALQAVNRCLQLPVFGKRVDLGAGDDEMIQHPDADQVQRLLQGLRQLVIGGTGLQRAGGMVMRQHDAGGIVRQRRLDHFARIDAGVGQGAAEQFLGADQAVLDVQEQHQE